MNKQRSKQLNQKPGPCTVRECDETETGRFVAYVDEKDDTYDVYVSLDPEKKVTGYSCDCRNKKPCIHINALVKYVTNTISKKTRKPVLKNKAAEEQRDEYILQHLIDLEEWERASERLWDMYEHSKAPIEKLRRLQQLKSVATQSGKVPAISKVLTLLVHQSYNLDDLMLLQKYIDPEQWNELKKQLIADAITSLHKDPVKFRFAFQLFEAEKYYEGMLSILHNTYSYEFIEPAVRSLAAFDPGGFLRQMSGIR
ncbi:MAG: hypothetical protein EOO04_25170, partial [Chitinophagaceae bacterium]